MNGFNLGLNDMNVIVIKSRFFFSLWVWREDRLGNCPWMKLWRDVSLLTIRICLYFESAETLLQSNLAVIK